MKASLTSAKLPKSLSQPFIADIKRKVEEALQDIIGGTAIPSSITTDLSSFNGDLLQASALLLTDTAIALDISLRYRSNAKFLHPVVYMTWEELLANLIHLCTNAMEALCIAGAVPTPPTTATGAPSAAAETLVPMDDVDADNAHVDTQPTAQDHTGLGTVRTTSGPAATTTTTPLPQPLSLTDLHSRANETLKTSQRAERCFRVLAAKVNEVKAVTTVEAPTAGTTSQRLLGFNINSSEKAQAISSTLEDPTVHFLTAITELAPVITRLYPNTIMLSALDGTCLSLASGPQSVKPDTATRSLLIGGYEFKKPFLPQTKVADLSSALTTHGLVHTQDTGKPYLMFPIPLVCLASVVKQEGLETTLLQRTGTSFDTLLETLGLTTTASTNSTSGATTIPTSTAQTTPYFNELRSSRRPATGAPKPKNTGLPLTPEARTWIDNQMTAPDTAKLGNTCRAVGHISMTPRLTPTATNTADDTAQPPLTPSGTWVTHVVTLTDSITADFSTKLETGRQAARLKASHLAEKAKLAEHQGREAAATHILNSSKGTSTMPTSTKDASHTGQKRGRAHTPDHSKKGKPKFQSESDTDTYPAGKRARDTPSHDASATPPTGVVAPGNSSKNNGFKQQNASSKKHKKDKKDKKVKNKRS
jgi:hypothetical protein